jgi:hypothetical protein
LATQRRIAISQIAKLIVACSAALAELQKLMV